VASTEELRESFVSFSKKVSTLKFFISFNYPLVKTFTDEPVFCDTSDCPKPIQKFRQLHSLGIQNLENKDYVAARDCFQEQLQYCKNEWQQRIPYYNITCCESLLGNVTSAFEFLEKTVACGFRNRNKLLTDPDLNNLREISSEKFQALIEKIKSQKENDCERGDRGDRGERGGRGCWRQNWTNNENNGEKPWRKKYCRENAFNSNQESKDPLIIKKEGEIKVNDVPVVTPEVKKESETKTLEQEIKVNEPVVLPSEVKNNEPEIEGNEKTFGKKLEALAEMGFTDKGKNVKALVAANGNPRLAVSIFLDSPQ